MCYAARQPDESAVAIRKPAGAGNGYRLRDRRIGGVRIAPSWKGRSYGKGFHRLRRLVTPLLPEGRSQPQRNFDEESHHLYGDLPGHPGRGGWAAILCLVGSTARRELVGGARLTTNNRMELGGVIAALSALREACEVDLYTDSKYVCDAGEKGWLAGWQKRNWIKSDKKPVLNVDLWKQLLPLLRTHKVTFHWLRGHAGHRENERCDELARAFAAGPDLP